MNQVTLKKMVTAAKISAAALPKGIAKLAHGQPVLDVAAALETAGLNGDDLPVLGLAGAKWEMLHVLVDSAGGVYFGEDQDGIERSSFALWTANITPAEETVAVSIVPLIPSSIAPARITDKHFILFEPQWTNVRKVPVAADPVLLRHLRGTLFAIEATWDMTKAEAQAASAAIASRDDSWDEWLGGGSDDEE